MNRNGPPRNQGNETITLPEYLCASKRAERFIVAAIRGGQIFVIAREQEGFELTIQEAKRMMLSLGPQHTGVKLFGVHPVR